jgi:predicted nucleic acid-binding protein
VKTAIDTSVLVDVLVEDTVHAQASARAIRAAYDAGALVACDVVWSEIRAVLADEAIFRRTMEALGVGFDGIDREAAELAGVLWRDYHRTRRARGVARHRMVADFLVGAHAMRRTDRLLTRDRGFYRGVFAGLTVIEP